MNTKQESWKIEPLADATCGGKPGMLRTVQLGREFIVEGRVRQSSLSSPIPFALLEVRDRFKFGDEWCIKVSTTTACALETGLPFGHATTTRVQIESDQKVRALVVDDRGPA